MKLILPVLSAFISSRAISQSAANIIIVTTDGFRLQGIYKGRDSSIANNNKFNQRDSAYIFQNTGRMILQQEEKN